jgi:MSHA pilin protein MshA
MLKQLPNNHQSGFTLIELIMVIVVLGALAVTALPRYIDLEAQAQQGAVEGIAGALAAGSAINFADCMADIASGTCLRGAAMDDCAEVAGTVLGGVVAGYAITTPDALGAGTGTATTCTIAGIGGAGNPPITVTVDFTALTPP